MTTTLARRGRKTRLLSRDMLNKVPEGTLYFWVIKVLSTTGRKTAADNLNSSLTLGLTKPPYVRGTLLLLARAVHFAPRRYVPPVYWLAVVLISIVGTLITDNL